MRLFNRCKHEITFWTIPYYVGTIKGGGSSVVFDTDYSPREQAKVCRVCGRTLEKRRV